MSIRRSSSSFTRGVSRCVRFGGRFFRRLAGAYCAPEPGGRRRSDRPQHRTRLRKSFPQFAHHPGHQITHRSRTRRAEIEFENGSTLRITPGTVVEFPELALRDSGARASHLELQTGTAYLNFNGDKREEFTLSFGPEKLVLTRPAHLRIELKDANATVAVFKGEVEVEGSSGQVHLEKKHSATFDLAGSDAYTLANNLEPDPYDDWDKQQDKYHQQYSASNSFSPYSYGVSDLNYYGSFYNIPGYGMMWQPYLVGAGWDPFMNGAWTWYPGAGYTWVSAYPWGWTPYRYGSWTYLSSYGWFWQPGSTWAGWNTGPQIANAPSNLQRTPAAGQAGTDSGRQSRNARVVPCVLSKIVRKLGRNTRRFRGPGSSARQRAQPGKDFAADGANRTSPRRVCSPRQQRPP